MQSIVIDRAPPLQILIFDRCSVAGRAALLLKKIRAKPAALAAKALPLSKSFFNLFLKTGISILGRLDYQRYRSHVRANLNGRTFGKNLSIPADDPVLIEEQRERERQRDNAAKALKEAEAVIAAADPKRVRELNKECRFLRRSGKIEWTTDYRLWVAERLKAETDGLSLQ